MKQVDLIVQKEQELKRLSDTIRNLEEKLANVNILLGGKNEELKSRDNEIKKLKDESNKSDRVIIKTVRRGGPFGNYGTEEDVTYKNLDDVKNQLKTEVEKKTKKSISDLENLQLDLEIKIETLEKEIARKDKQSRAQNEEWEEKTRKRYNKLIEGHREEIDELKETIQKIKKDKTDEQLEKLRAEEVNTLKLTIETLTKRLEEMQKMNWFRRIINSLFNVEAQKQAMVEIYELQKKYEFLNKQIDSANRSYVRYNSATSPNCVYGTHYYYN